MLVYTYYKKTMMSPLQLVYVNTISLTIILDNHKLIWEILK